MLVTSAASDVRVVRVARALTRRGVSAHVFDPAGLLGPYALDVAHGPTERTTRVTGPDFQLDARDVRSVYWQRPAALRLPDALTADQAAWVREQAEAWLEAFWADLHVPWLPGRLHDARLAARKLHQLSVAREVGLSVPRTLVTRDAQRALEFYDACEGQVVSKALAGGGLRRDGQERLAFTHVVTRRDLQSVSAVGLAPVVFQERVAKARELRVTVVGSRVFAAALASDESALTREDVRRAEHVVSVTAHLLDPDVQARCLALMRALRLSYGALDLLVTPQGRHVFLEVNPSGRWLWIEERTGLPITDAIAEHLATGAA